MYMNYKARNWIRVQATIINSKIKTNKIGSEPNTYDLNIKYKYSIDNKEYLSNRVNFGDLFGSSIKLNLEEYLLKYKDNYQIEGFVNPNKPSLSVLEIKTSYIYIINYITFIVFICVFYYFFT